MEDSDYDAYEDDSIDSPAEDDSTDTSNEDSTTDGILDSHNEDVQRLCNEDTTTQIENEGGSLIVGSEVSQYNGPSFEGIVAQTKSYEGDEASLDDKNVFDSTLNTYDCHSECKHNTGKGWKSADYGYSG